jgi:SP family sugar:H+ symporter-like MFS transporter
MDSGYDTGQISDILIMEDFLRRFGEPDGSGGYAFSHKREGLIVAMLSIGTLVGGSRLYSGTQTAPL